MRNTLLLTPLLLAACATPYEICIAQAQQDIRVLDGLIAQTRGNIQRGYALQQQEQIDTVEQYCGEQNGQPVFCEVPVVEVFEVPVAIDMDSEQAKLASLLKTRDRKQREAQQAAARCAARYPEG